MCNQLVINDQSFEWYWSFMLIADDQSVTVNKVLGYNPLVTDCID